MFYRNLLLERFTYSDIRERIVRFGNALEVLDEHVSLVVSGILVWLIKNLPCHKPNLFSQDV
jgi:hypothetical protein